MNRTPRVNHHKLDATVLSVCWQEYVKRRSVPNDQGCWIWSGGIGGNGYGIASVKRWPVYAHRLSYFAFKGKIPPGFIALHNCHIRRCVNPDHIRQGTSRDNIMDALRIGTLKRIPLSKSTHKGSAHGRSKLTESQIPEILKMRSKGFLQREIALKFNISRSQIAAITGGRSWKHQKN